MSVEGREGNAYGDAFDAGPSRLEAAWRELGESLGLAEAARMDGAAVARAVAGDVRDPERRRNAMVVLLRIVEAIGIEKSVESLVPVVHRFITSMPGPQLTQFVTAMEVPDRRRFFRGLAAIFPTPTVLVLTRAMATAYGEPLSKTLDRLLEKLRLEAETEDEALRPRSQQTFRSLVVHLVENWSANAISGASDGYTALFDTHERRQRNRLTPEPARVVQLSLETGAIGNVVWGAVAEQSRTEEGMRELFDMIKRAPDGSRSVALIIDHIATPARLSALLREDAIDFDLVDTLVTRLGLNAARPLIDELAESKLRSTRRAIMDRLVLLGPEIGPFVLERIQDPRWYVVRNMIALLREAGCPLDSVPMEKLRTHDDGRVRRESLQLQLENPKTREAALIRALVDTDRNVLRAALQAARSNLPESAVPALASRVTDADYPPEFRVMSLYLLGRTGSVHALEALLAFVQGGTSLLGRPKLAPRTPEMLAALGGLARSWSNERRAAPLLELARRSKDDQILNALNTSGSSQ